MVPIRLGLGIYVVLFSNLEAQLQPCQLCLLDLLLAACLAQLLLNLHALHTSDQGPNLHCHETAASRGCEKLRVQMSQVASESCNQQLCQFSVLSQTQLQH